MKKMWRSAEWDREERLWNQRCRKETGAEMQASGKKVCSRAVGIGMEENGKVRGASWVNEGMTKIKLQVLGMMTETG